MIDQHPKPALNIPEFEAAFVVFENGTENADDLRAAIDTTISGLRCAEEVVAQLDAERERLLLSRASIDDILMHDLKIDRARIVLEKFDALGEALNARLDQTEGTHFSSGLARVAAAARA